MRNGKIVRGVKAKNLGPALRRRLQLGPEDEVDLTVKKRSTGKPIREKDLWKEIKGILTHEEAEEMLPPASFELTHERTTRAAKILANSRKISSWGGRDGWGER